MFKKLSKVGQTLEIEQVVRGDVNFSISHIAHSTRSQLSLLILADADVNVDVTIDKKASSSNCHLDIKIVDDESKVTIAPNFTVKNNTSTVSHEISTVTSAAESVFYAACRGVSEKNLKELAISGLIKKYES